MPSLAEEMPLAAVVADDMITSTCSTCFEVNEKRDALVPCDQCRVIHYCSKACQKKDWHIHKAECKYLKKCPAAPDVDIRLFCRIMILRAAGSLPVADNGRTWDGLTDHKTEILSNQDYSDLFRRINTFLDSIRSDVDVPEQEELISIFGKIRINSFEIIGNKFMVLGSAIYLGLAVHDHSCAPDCFVVFEGAKAILRSPIKDVTYSTKLAITYTDLMVSTYDRQDALKRKYFFDCKCRVCTDLIRDHWGRSAYASCCDNGVCPLDPQAESLSCNLCKKPSPLKIGDVEKDILALDYFLGNLVTSVKSTGEEYELMQDKDSRLNKILSPYNFLMIKLWEKTSDVAGIRGFNHVDKRLDAVGAYKYYLPLGSPTLTAKLFLAAIASEKMKQPKQKTLDLIEEAYKAAVVSHGHHHPITDMIRESHVRIGILTHSLTHKESNNKKEGKKSKKGH